jgi:rfaE bifunctional protein nucleotidyltransferase chain/domain
MPELFDTANWRTEKIVTLDFGGALASEYHAMRKSVVTLNGSFDILHAGHLDQLEEAKLQGDILFVGINSDESIREGKGAGRPYITAEARAALLAALACTDFIIIIDASYQGGVPKALIEAVKPDIHVNGSDYGPVDSWLEWPTMQRFGTKGYVVRHRNALSTTDLVKKIRSAHPEG